ncbi:MAG: Formate hydrogenlyase subunit 3/multisubunit Na+/H+ antiporter, MnhD subunit [Parcubacteria group bacterium GW2011_GWA2_33_14]|uniref:Hydrogenase 4 subunit B n=1 Tax=Candidatus Staskawiczbacteria bacterium RIFCSPHIGHO2_02_FULL_33_16 TaxID=1802204 RepID=A0A1G2HY00_9BACT|nr:MAG: Formate hydrogenlyase subunit 3/multisubunit Na+/H+ antiporter, MnhD subunit [Parcubacteria group bacterium GW2011_GWA2_33_14]OGZ67289.1 MAG: hypothetical protein A3D34_00790 [Candidatus Staskawiczbacteria bacterium RIFCSPHIGHO2_02_FULL_33_16]OGZ70193.1 MAG: hypothetical protein A2980_00320 [Candidatus Staskawiczbacteria bacterium RIFCSPLOWO2_01_FULL_33_13]
MMSTIIPQIIFFTVLSFFVIGGIGSLLFRKNDVLANRWSSFFAIFGSVIGLFFVALIIINGYDISFSLGTLVLPLFSVSFHIDKLSAFFIFIISLISLFCSVYAIGYVKHFYEKYNIGFLGFFYNMFILGMLLVVSSSNWLLFLIAWEVMSITSYFLVIYDRQDPQNVKAGFLYLIMTHVGTAFIVLAALLLYKFTDSFDFRVIQANSSLIPLSIKNIIFIFAIIGFGTKSGIIPFHIWLPDAHPAAPSHVSALMSGVMIKTGIYMMIRIFLYMIWPVPVWWGLALLILGSISSLMGVLYALTEHDIKRLLAYHSIENIGIILLGLGGALTFLSLNMPTPALLSLTAALFHTLNHATFKSLLFLSAGSIINQTHTRNMEEYGGLIKYMPYTALFFLVGSMAISALPPFNGFFSEWLTFQSLFQGIALLPLYEKLIFILAAGSLAFTGGLALACFVKAFGATFLARPRSAEISHAKESSFSLQVGMGGIALLCLLIGLYSGHIAIFLENIVKDLEVFKNTTSFMSVSGQSIVVEKGFGSVSSLLFFVFFVLVIALVIGVIKFVINRNQKIETGSTWDCGTDLAPRMEITATGFSRSIIMIFRGILRPSIQHDIEYHDAQSRYLPKSRTIIFGLHDVYQSYFYQPLYKMINAISSQTKKIQSGNTNAYILYIFIALIISLLFVLWR